MYMHQSPEARNIRTATQLQVLQANYISETYTKRKFSMPIPSKKRKINLDIPSKVSKYKTKYIYRGKQLIFILEQLPLFSLNPKDQSLSKKNLLNA